MNKEGSCLLTILLLISMISFFCLHMWRTTVLLFDTAVAKQEFQQQSYLVQGLLSWAIDLCKNNYDLIIDHITLNPQGLSLEIPHWQLNKTFYTGTLLCMNKIKDNLYYLHLVAQLVTKKNTFMQVSCDLYKEYDANEDTNRFRIGKWHFKNKA